MQVKLPVFRSFIKDQIIGNGLPTWSEMAWNTRVDDEIPLSKHISVLLSYIPGGEAAQAQALHYIQTKGLFKASLGRKKIAQEATKQLGRKVYEHEIFSKTAWEESKKMGEKPDLHQIVNEMMPEFHEHYELDKIPIKTGSRKVNKDDGGKTLGGDYYVSLNKLNAIMQKDGHPPFTLGGPDGYLEWMENSNWSKPYVLKPNIAPIKPGDVGERHKRRGADLSDPQLVQSEEKPGTYQYRYNDTGDGPTFTPATDIEQYTKRLRRLNAKSGPEIDKLRGQESPESPYLQDVQGDKGSYHAWLKGLKSNTNARLHPFISGNATAEELPEDEELKNAWIKAIDLGIKAVAPTYGWSEEEQADVRAQILDKKPGFVIPRYTDPVKRKIEAAKPNAKDRKDVRNQLNVQAVMNAGIAADPSLKSAFEKNAKGFSVGGDASDYTGPAEYEYEPIDIDKVLKDQEANGFKPRDGDTLDDQLKAGFVVLVRGNNRHTRETFKIERGEDGRWYYKKPVGIGANAKKKKYDPSNALLPGYVDKDQYGNTTGNSVGTIEKAGSSLRAGVDDKTYDDIRDDFERNPESYGDSTTKNGVPSSIEKAAGVGLYRAVQRYNGAYDSKTIKSWMGGEEGLYGVAFEAMKKLMGTYHFKFGNPSKTFDKETNTDIRSLMAEEGVEDKDWQDYFIDLFYNIVNKEHREPNQSDFSKHPSVYNAFLKNGMHWRASQAGSVVANYIDTEIKNNQKFKTGMGGKDADGNDSALVGGNISDKEGKGYVDQRNDTEKRKISASDAVKSVGDAQSSLIDPRAKFTTRLNPIFSSRGDYINVDGYKPAYKAAKDISNKEISDFMKKPANIEHDDFNERDTMRRTTFAPLARMMKTISDASGKPDSTRVGTVDGVGDAIANFVLNHMADSHVANHQVGADWWDKISSLYHAFIIDNPKYDYKGAADQVGVEVGEQWDKIKGLLAQEEAWQKAHNHIDQTAKERRKQDVDDETAVRNQYRVPATPTATPGTPSVPSKPQQMGQGVQTNAGYYMPDDDEDETPIKKGVKGYPTPGQARQMGNQNPNQRYGVAENHIISFDDYKNMKLKEMSLAMGNNPKIKLPDGCGFNIWGAPGRAGGVSIAGEVKKSKKGKK